MSLRLFQMKGTVTYNGHKLDEFVPQKTAVYISQNDLHVAHMTVRETLDFSARCQGTGTRYGQTTGSFYTEVDISLCKQGSSEDSH